MTSLFSNFDTAQSLQFRHIRQSIGKACTNPYAEMYQPRYQPDQGYNPNKRQRQNTSQNTGQMSDKETLAYIKQMVESIAHNQQQSNQNISSLCQSMNNLQAGQTLCEDRLQKLEMRVIDMEARSRKQNLIFFNLYEKQNENPYETEEELYRFLHQQLNLDIQHIVFQDVHRLGRNPTRGIVSPKPRPIIASFRDMKWRDWVIQHSNKLAGTQFSIKEDFPVEIRRARAQLWPEYQQAKSGNEFAKIQYPAKLVVGNRIVRNSFPQWGKWAADNIIAPSNNQQISQPGSGSPMVVQMQHLISQARPPRKNTQQQRVNRENNSVQQVQAPQQNHSATGRQAPQQNRQGNAREVRLPDLSQLGTSHNYNQANQQVPYSTQSLNSVAQLQDNVQQTSNVPSQQLPYRAPMQTAPAQQLAVPQQQINRPSQQVPQGTPVQMAPAQQHLVPQAAPPIMSDMQNAPPIITFTAPPPVPFTDNQGTTQQQPPPMTQADVDLPHPAPQPDTGATNPWS